MKEQNEKVTGARIGVSRVTPAPVPPEDEPFELLKLKIFISEIERRLEFCTSDLC